MHAFSAPKTLDNLTVFCFQGVEKRCTGNEWVNGKFIWLFFQTKPTSLTYILQNLQGHFSSDHFLLALLNAARLLILFNLIGFDWYLIPNFYLILNLKQQQQQQKQA